MTLTRVALVLCLAAGVVRPAFATSTITMLDTASDVGRFTRLAIGADGLGLIAYYDLTNRDLKVAHCSDTACTAATVSTIDAGDVEGVSSLVIGADGRGLIAYFDRAGPGAVKTAHCNDLACTSAAVRVIQTAVTGRIGMAIGSDGLPLLAYVNGFTLRAAHCSVPDCTSATITSLGSAPGTADVVVTMGANGLALIAVGRLTDFPPEVRHCQNVLCTATGPPEPPSPGPAVIVTPQALAVPADGRPLLGYGADLEARFSRCTDALCTAQTPVFAITSAENADVALQPNGLPWLAYGEGTGRIALRSCGDAACSTATVACANAHTVFHISLARGADGRSLVAFYRFLGGLGVVHDVSDECADPHVGAADASVVETTSAQASFLVTLTAPSALPVTVEYATSDGTAVAGQDYVPTSGTLTFAPGATSAVVPVTVLTDLLIEADETFFFTLSAAVGATVLDWKAVGTIVDGTPALHAGSCERVEGDAGTQGCVIAVSLAPAAAQTVTVAYATADGTANAGSDYVASSGTMTFAPGAVSQSASVSVIGDTAVELDETFLLSLSNPVNAAIGDGQGQGLIVDDDAASLSSLELTHGARVRADLAAGPGPSADEDFYRLAQTPYSSWEVVADEVSGDVAPGLLLERLAEDNSTVLQIGSPVGSGPARAMRWQRRAATAEVRQHIRVRSTSCMTDCGTDDTYRLRVHETTGRIPRFNNSGTQVTVLILQNATGQPIEANVDFWDGSGGHRATVPIPLGPNAADVVTTSSVPGLAGLSGSITITHDGPYGGLVGKAVALEPSTGFSFDSPMTVKPR